MILYQEILRIYIETLDKQRGLIKEGGEIKTWSLTDKERLLERLAFGWHCSAFVQAPNSSEQNKALYQQSHEELAGEFETIIEKGKEEGANWEKVEQGDGHDLVDYFIARTGLLSEPEEGKVQFFHLSFQEFLTAAYLKRQWVDIFDRNEFIEKYLKSDKRLHQAFWHEAFILFFNLLILEGSDNIVLRVFKELEEEDFPTELTLKLLADPHQFQGGKAEELIQLAFDEIVQNYSVDRMELLFKLKHHSNLIAKQWKKDKKISRDKMFVVANLLIWDMEWFEKPQKQAFYRLLIAKPKNLKLLSLIDFFTCDEPNLEAVFVSQIGIEKLLPPPASLFDWFGELTFASIYNCRLWQLSSFSRLSSALSYLHRLVSHLQFHYAVAVWQDPLALARDLDQSRPRSFTLAVTLDLVRDLFRYLDQSRVRLGDQSRILALSLALVLARYQSQSKLDDRPRPLTLAHDLALASLDWVRPRLLAHNLALALDRAQEQSRLLELLLSFSYFVLIETQHETCNIRTFGTQAEIQTAWKKLLPHLDNPEWIWEQAQKGHEPKQGDDRGREVFIKGYQEYQKSPKFIGKVVKEILDEDRPLFADVRSKEHYISWLTQEIEKLTR